MPLQHWLWALRSRSRSSGKAANRHPHVWWPPGAFWRFQVQTKGMFSRAWLGQKTKSLMTGRQDKKEKKNDITSSQTSFWYCGCSRQAHQGRRLDRRKAQATTRQSEPRRRRIWPRQDKTRQDTEDFIDRSTGNFLFSKRKLQKWLVLSSHISFPASMIVCARPSVPEQQHFDGCAIWELLPWLRLVY